jgi:hypothetical protein
MYAEAKLGVASQSEIAQQLEWTIHRMRVGVRDKTPLLWEWYSEEKGLSVDDFVEVVRESTKKSGALITEPAIGEPNQSEMGTMIVPVKSRGTAVDSETLKFWDVVMANYGIVDGEVNSNFFRSCQCNFTDPHVNRRKLWSDRRADEKKFQQKMVESGFESLDDITTPLHLACYHEAAAITRMEMENNQGAPRTIPNLAGTETSIAYDIPWDLVLEAAARRYHFKHKYAKIDDFLFENDIVSDLFKKLMKEGKVKREVMKQGRWFDHMAKAVIMRLHERMVEKGYDFAGFARDFVGCANSKKDYQTVGIVYEKGDLAYHVVYDNTFYIPFVVEKKFGQVMDTGKPAIYRRNPVRLCVRKANWWEIDDRTGQLASIRVYRPQPATIKGIEGAESAYKQYLGFMKKAEKKR